MSLQNIKPAIERKEQLEKLVELLRKGRYGAARDYADNLLEGGIPETLINSSCHGYFSLLNRTQRRRAERLAKVFQDYRWQYWLR